MIGLLGLLGWKVTIYPQALLLMLILDYGDEHSAWKSTRLPTIKGKFSKGKYFRYCFNYQQNIIRPILYTVLTTIIAFLSLIFGEIKPIIDFEWMMTIGLIS